MTNSTKKGKRGERELCRALREQGYGAIRSQQVAGISSIDKTADILTSMPHVRWEVKRTAADTKLSHQSTIEDWVDTAIAETPEGEAWVIGWRPDHGDWRFLVPSWILTVDDDPYPVELEAPWVLVPTVEAICNCLDPSAHFTVMEPDDWMLDDETQLA